MELNVESLRPLIAEKLTFCDILDVEGTLSTIYSKYNEEKTSPDRGDIQAEVHAQFEKLQSSVMSVLRQAEEAAIDHLAPEKFATCFFEDFDSGILNEDSDFKDKLLFLREKLENPIAIPTKAALDVVGSCLLGELTAKLSVFRDSLLTVPPKASAPVIKVEGVLDDGAV